MKKIFVSIIYVFLLSNYYFAMNQQTSEKLDEWEIVHQNDNLSQVIKPIIIVQEKTTNPLQSSQITTYFNDSSLETGSHSHDNNNNDQIIPMNEQDFIATEYSIPYLTVLRFVQQSCCNCFAFCDFNDMKNK